MFCRYCFIDVDEGDVENINLSVEPTSEIAAYVRSVTHEYLVAPVYTSNINVVVEKFKKNSRISLKGIKGAGKTFTLVILFLLCYLQKINCILLSPLSFDANTSCAFFKSYVKSHTSEEDQPKTLELLEKDRRLEALQFIFEKYSNSVIIFVDFSCIKYSQNAVTLFSLLNGRAYGARTLISLTSGIELLGPVKSMSKVMAQGFSKYLMTFTSVHIESFTENDAVKYMTKRGTALKYDQVSFYSGNNPLMLEQLDPDCENVHDYKGKLYSFVKHIFLDEIKFLDKKNELLEQYLMKKEILECRKFAYYASREDELSQEERGEYSETFLCKYHLTMLKVTQLHVVPDDKDDSEEIEQDATEGGTKEVLCWNFPIFAEIFNDILTKFIENETTEQIQNCCENASSFAGFWYEKLFFKHHSLETSRIKLAYMKVHSTDTTDPSSLELQVDAVKQLEPLQDKLQEGILYELKTNHPIVDGIGYLCDTKGEFWLVFIQVSLQTYKKHRSMCDIFKRPPNKDAFIKKKNISYFTHYRRAFNINFGYKNFGICVTWTKEQFQNYITNNTSSTCTS